MGLISDLLFHRNSKKSLYLLAVLSIFVILLPSCKKDLENDSNVLIMALLLSASGQPSQSASNNNPPEQTRAACTHTVSNGTYSTNITASSYPNGSVVCAETDGGVTFTGNFQPSGSTYRGFIIKSANTKSLGAGRYERLSFVNGPLCGNNVNLSIGSDVTLLDSAIYGVGGRYGALAYGQSGVTLINVIFRPDGGWGETSACNEFEPNAALNFYDSDNVKCDACILLDYRSTAQSDSENIGGLGVNCHGTAVNAEFTNSMIYNSPRFYMDGNGTCNNTNINNSAYQNGDSYGLTRNVNGSTSVSNFNSDAKCGAWTGSINITDSIFSGSDGCSGGISGSPATLVLDANFLNETRWKNEMCNQAGVAARGWCSTALSLSDYLTQ